MSLNESVTKAIQEQLPSVVANELKEYLNKAAVWEKQIKEIPVLKNKISITGGISQQEKIINSFYGIKLERDEIRNNGTTNECPIEIGTLLLAKWRSSAETYYTAKEGCEWNSKDYIYAYKIIAPASEKWIAWEGGECPVDENIKVGVLQRSGITDIDCASNFYWESKGYACDIIAYRFVEEEKESRIMGSGNIVTAIMKEGDKDIYQAQNERMKNKQTRCERIKAELDDIENKTLTVQIKDSYLNLIQTVEILQKKIDYLIEELFGENK